MGAPLYKNLEGMSQSRGLPGGYGTTRPGAGGQRREFGGLSGTLSRIAAGRGGGRPAVYQPITPTAMPNYSGKMGGAGAIGIALKGVGNVMQAIENYKAAQDMLTIAQEERDAAKEQAARELMEKSRAPLIALAQTMNEMPEEERAAFGQELMEGGAAQGLDPSSMNLLKLTMKSSLNLPSEAEAAGKKALTEKQSGKYGELTGGAIALAGLTPEDVAKMPPEKLRKYVQEYLVSTKAGGNTNTTNVNLGKTPPGAVEAQTINGAFLKRLKRIKDGFKPEYVGAWMGGDLDGWATRFKSATGQLSPEAATWFAEVAGVKNMKIKIASGATVPVGEVPRLMEEITSVMDSDVGFIAKLGVMETVAMEEMGEYAKNLEAGGYLPVGGDTGGGETSGSNSIPDINTMSLEEVNKAIEEEQRKRGMRK